MIHPDDETYIATRKRIEKNWEQLRALFVALCIVMAIANVVDWLKAA